MFYTNYVEQNKKQTPGCFVILSSSRDCKNLDSETYRTKKRITVKPIQKPTLLYKSLGKKWCFVCVF